MSSFIFLPWTTLKIDAEIYSL